MPWEYMKARISIYAPDHRFRVRVDGVWVNANELGAQNYELVAVVENAVDPEESPVGVFKRFVSNGEEERR